MICLNLSNVYCGLNNAGYWTEHHVSDTNECSNKTAQLSEHINHRTLIFQLSGVFVEILGGKTTQVAPPVSYSHIGPNVVLLVSGVSRGVVNLSGVSVVFS